MNEEGDQREKKNFFGANKQRQLRTPSMYSPHPQNGTGSITNKAYPTVTRVARLNHLNQQKLMKKNEGITPITATMEEMDGREKIREEEGKRKRETNPEQTTEKGAEPVSKKIRAEIVEPEEFNFDEDEEDPKKPQRYHAANL